MIIAGFEELLRLARARFSFGGGRTSMPTPFSPSSTIGSRATRVQLFRPFRPPAKLARPVEFFASGIETRPVAGSTDPATEKPIAVMGLPARASEPARETIDFVISVAAARVVRRV